MNIKRSASIYFQVQGIAVFVWWATLLFAPVTRKYFQMGDGETVLLAFWLPDLFLLGVSSIAAGILCRKESKFLIPFLWFTVGTISYASFYCLSFALLTDTGWLGVTLMFPAMIWSGNFAIALTPAIRDLMFRRAKESKTGWIIAKTLIQIVVVWTLILLVFPSFIVLIEARLGIAQISFPHQKIVATILFVLLSSVGVSAAVTMSKIGRGTPLPFDTANRLVIKGIYAYVRNPMAVSGIGQGFAVALFLGSPLVFLYALTGAFIWQIIFRPLEEEDLLKNFGADYEKYRRNVRCWTPNFKKFELR